MPFSSMLRIRYLSLPVLILALFALMHYDRHSETATVDGLMLGLLSDLEEEFKKAGISDDVTRKTVLHLEGDAPTHANRISAHIDRSSLFETSNHGHFLLIEMDLSASIPSSRAIYAIDTPYQIEINLSRSPISALSLFPAILAIFLAFATGKVIFSLGTAVVFGAVLSAGINPLDFTVHAANDYFYKATLTDSFKLWIIAFTCGLLGIVRLAVRAGGVQGIVDRISGHATGAKATQRVTAAMGLTVFFDDYANTVLVGSTMRTLSDRFRIAREKLAYIVDSTAAPIAGTALISTWIGFEIGLLSDAASGLGLERDGYALFLSALPFRFYCLFTLAFVAILVIRGRDFGPMLKAERRARSTGQVFRPGSKPLSGPSSDKSDDNCGVMENISRRMAHVALIPVFAVLAGTILGLFIDGGGFKDGSGGIISPAVWRNAFGDAENSTMVMGIATIFASVILFALVGFHRLMSFRQAIKAYLEGMWSMHLAVAILVLAWAMKAVCDDLGADLYLVSALSETLHPVILPLAVFLLAAIVAFSTGTSWGTMAILIPVAVPLSYEVGGAALTFLTMAAVLDGAIFGDHCSPVSDTTIMTSIATGCDHMDHVRTQIPYALFSMTVAALCGYIWSGMGFPWWAGMLGGILIMIAVIWLFGKDADKIKEVKS